jgi:hypothetical protein
VTAAACYPLSGGAFSTAAKLINFFSCAGSMSLQRQSANKHNSPSANVAGRLARNDSAAARHRRITQLAQQPRHLENASLDARQSGKKHTIPGSLFECASASETDKTSFDVAFVHLPDLVNVPYQCRGQKSRLNAN